MAGYKIQNESIPPWIQHCCGIGSRSSLKLRIRSRCALSGILIYCHPASVFLLQDKAYCSEALIKNQLKIKTRRYQYRSRHEHARKKSAQHGKEGRERGGAPRVRLRESGTRRIERLGPSRGNSQPDRVCTRGEIKNENGGCAPACGYFQGTTAKKRKTAKIAR